GQRFEDPREPLVRRSKQRWNPVDPTVESREHLGETANACNERRLSRARGSPEPDDAASLGQRGRQLRLELGPPDIVTDGRGRGVGHPGRWDRDTQTIGETRPGPGDVEDRLVREPGGQHHAAQHFWTLGDEVDPNAALSGGAPLALE